MGKRYGRNQKRRHREMIETLRQQNNQALKREQRWSRRHRTVEQDLKDLVEAIHSVQPLTAFMPPKTLRGIRTCSATPL